MLRFDPYLILLYKLTGDPLLDYFLGTFLLAFLSVIVGDVTSVIVSRVNKRYTESLTRDLIAHNTLSLEAMKSSDGQLYQACNTLANEAFGKVFFHLIALSASSLWPIFFALAWMQSRFVGIELPLPVRVPMMGNAVGYSFLFFLLYAISRLLFPWVKSKLLLAWSLLRRRIHLF
ncbi:MAG: hypothetical protein D6736_17955 [Nitrospinota bacterium]|nr:MAG: hypothetical protein D6736_17955 [Nitrospinota bacterium]